MHHQGHKTTEVGGDHFRSTGVKLRVTVPFFPHQQTSSSAGTSPMKEKKNKDCANHSQEGDRFPTMLVMSGGEGYVDFRVGDGDDEEEDPG